MILQFELPVSGLAAGASEADGRLQVSATDPPGIIESRRWAPAARVPRTEPPPAEAAQLRLGPVLAATRLAAQVKP